MNDNISNNISSKDWISWLKSIENQSSKEKSIVYSKSTYKFTKRSLFQKKVDIKHIINISKHILKDESGKVTLKEKEDILSSLSYLLNKRTEKFEKLSFVSKFFAELRGIPKKLEKEKESVQQLYVHLSKEKLNELNNEIQILKNIEKKLYAGLENEKFKSYFHKEVSLLNQKLQTLKQNINHFQLKDKELEDKIAVLEQDLKNLFQLMKTGFRLPTIEKIETVWKRILNQTEQTAEEHIIDNHHIIFIPEDRSIYIKEKLLGKGAFKAVFAATDYIHLNDETKKEDWVVIQPLTKDREEQINQQKLHDQTFQKKQSTQNSLSDLQKSEEIKEPSGTFVEKTTYEMGDETSSLKSEEQEDTESSGSFVVKTNKQKDDATSSLKSEEQEESNSSFVIKVNDQTISTEKFSSKVKSDDDQNSDEIPYFLRHIQANLQKSLSISQTNDEQDDIEAYQKEANLCLEIGHLPGIWSTHKVTTIDGQVAIIQKKAGFRTNTPHEEGKPTAQDLSHMLELFQINQLTSTEQTIYLQMIEDFLTGVQSMHNLKYIHRDLKPENVLCSAEGRAGVSDFGTVCKDISLLDSYSLEDEQEMQVFTGSNYYIAPEIGFLLQDRARWEEISTKADIWGIGIILWELLSKQNIFDHPAIGRENPNHYQVVAELFKLNQSPRLALYLEEFLEPSDHNTLLHMIWKCNRPQPQDRITIDELKTQYTQWVKKVKDSNRSIAEVVQEEFNNYKLQKLLANA